MTVLSFESVMSRTVELAQRNLETAKQRETTLREAYDSELRAAIREHSPDPELREYYALIADSVSIGAGHDGLITLPEHVRELLRVAAQLLPDEHRELTLAKIAQAPDCMDVDETRLVKRSGTFSDTRDGWQPARRAIKTRIQAEELLARLVPAKRAEEALFLVRVTIEHDRTITGCAALDCRRRLGLPDRTKLHTCVADDGKHDGVCGVDEQFARQHFAAHETSPLRIVKLTDLEAGDVTEWSANDQDIRLSASLSDERIRELWLVGRPISE